jgi:dihydroneopterin aldolase
MGKVALEGIEFFAYHGYYEEERKIGNKYEVNIEVASDLSDAAKTDSLSGTINYEVLYKVIQHEMMIPSKMLEHVGNRIVDKVMAEFSQIEVITVEISKFNPPIKGVCRKAKVTLTRSRKAV